MLADLVGLRSIAGAIGGGDPYTLQKWSKWECVANGIGGTITLVTSALGISRALGALTGSCSGWLGGSCFVGETLVATNWEPAPPAIVSAGTTDTDNSAIGWLMAGCGVVMISTVVRRKRDEEELESTLRPRDRRKTGLAEDDWSLPEPDGQWLERLSRRRQPEPVASIADRTETLDTVPHRVTEQVRSMPTLPIPSRTSVSRTPRRWNLLSAICLLAAVCCFWQGLPAVSSLWKDQAQANVAPALATQRQLEHVQIKDLRPGRRVIAKNPELAGNEIPERSIDPEVDRLVSFRLEKPDGSFVEWDRIESLPDLFEAALLDTLVSLTDADVEALPASALLPENVDVRESDIDAATALRRVEQFLIGRMVDVDLAELGASGRATIQSIQPCAEVERDDGNGRRLVTAVFRHTTRDVYDLSLDDGTPSIGTTGNHPFWSVDRQQFVRADSLRHRECLQKANGSLCRVTSVTKRDLTEPVTVYNLEIDGEHVYNVGAGGVLVHNICVDANGRWRDDRGRFMKRPFGDLTDTKAKKHILNGDATGGGHRSGTGKPKKSEFPAGWSDEKILASISDVATDPRVKWSKPDPRGYITGSATIDGIDIKIVFDTKNNRIVTGFPTNVPRNP